MTTILPIILFPFSTGYQELLERSLFLLGEFGGNDYTHALLSGKNLNDILPIIPLVAKSIASGAHVSVWKFIFFFLVEKIFFYC